MSYTADSFGHTRGGLLTLSASSVLAAFGQQPAVGVAAVQGVARVPQVPTRDQHLAQKTLPQVEGKNF